MQLIAELVYDITFKRILYYFSRYTSVSEYTYLRNQKYINDYTDTAIKSTLHLIILDFIKKQFLSERIKEYY